MSNGRSDLSKDELYRRLEEAEDIIRAIREGEVDALVIKKNSALDEVFTLDGNDSYRSFMEAMDIGAAAFDSHGNLLYCNSALCTLLDVSKQSVLEGGFWNAFDQSNRTIVTAAMRAARDRKTTCETQISVDGRLRRLLLNSDALKLGVNDAVAVTFTDITDRIQAERNQEAERAALAILASAAEAVVVTDVDGVVTHANAAAMAMASRDPVGLSFGEAFALEFSAATGLMQGDDFISLAVSGQSIHGVEALAPRGRIVQDVLVSAAPLRVADNQTKGAVATLVDLSARKSAERQQLLLMRELDHRVKNTLALVVSISNRTASTEDSIEGFREAFAGRIHALAATHNILADRSWSSIRLSELVAAELAPFVRDYHRRFSIDGGDAEILPRAAVPLGLIIHELATNAAKYGALACEAGMVTVRLSSDVEGDSRVISWIESGGPEVSPPKRRGFGHTVVERSLKYSPAGGAEIVFDPAGVRCTIKVPVEDIAVSTTL
jgi:PAS domain S-box-containing protein